MEIWTQICLNPKLIDFYFSILAWWQPYGISRRGSLNPSFKDEETDLSRALMIYLGVLALTLQLHLTIDPIVFPQLQQLLRPRGKARILTVLRLKYKQEGDPCSFSFFCYASSFPSKRSKSYPSPSRECGWLGLFKVKLGMTYIRENSCPGRSQSSAAPEMVVTLTHMLTWALTARNQQFYWDRCWLRPQTPLESLPVSPIRCQFASMKSHLL